MIENFYDCSKTSEDICDPVQALHGAMLAKSVYGSPDSIHDDATLWGIIDSLFLGFNQEGDDYTDSGSTQGAIFLTENNDAIICIRGTKGWKDIKRDLKIKKTDSHIGRVHRGFHMGMEEVIEPVMDWLDAANPKSINLAAHSLGGGVIVDIAAELVHAGFKIAGGHLFGCPRVGGRLYMRHLVKKLGGIWQHRRGFDGVTHMPPCFPLGYSHLHGRGVFYDGDTGERVVQMSFWDRMRNWAEDLGDEGILKILAESFGDHPMSGYVDLCRQAVDESKSSW